MEPSVGRFVSMDLFAGMMHEPASLHKYLYAHANPIDNFDPSGYVTVGQTLQAVNIIGNMYTVASISFQIVTGNYAGAGKEIVEEIVFSKFGGAFGKRIAALSKRQLGLFYNLFKRGLRGTPRLG